MNRALFLSTVQRTYRLFAIFTALILFYLLVIMGMYTSSLETDPFAMLPEAMRNALGISAGLHGMTGFIATGFYGVTFVVFMIILCIIAANQLMANLVDRGSMAYFLATPISRRKIALTQAAVLLSGLFLLTSITTVVGLIVGPILNDQDDFNRIAFIQINVMGFLLFFAISGYAFFFSTLFNESKQSLLSSGALSVVFYMFQLLSNMSNDLKWLGRFTVLTFFKPAEIAVGSANLLPSIIGLGMIGLLFYWGAIYVFKRRDLPL
ncbi:ABC-2 type transport system permease protein [Paenibacillus endophyticus]|uniref:ABC-2 type transport system permease protein n=1 Tax=Paenibacillus endophyticus TaxID=1294268 RepID=A0A7W5CE07_9BACL|nr:ABC transporter permease subunit [Paenibacillus endophyticus]MBB3155945.1 ABC-2 type transport system permease protein [Paenibacillus endophyticus]